MSVVRTPNRTTPPQTFRIFSNVDVGGGNPYLDLFYRALSLYRIEFAGTFAPSSVWLRDNRDRIDALHFHWPEFLLRRCPPWLQRVYELRGGGVLQRLLTPHVTWRNVHRIRKVVSAARRINTRIIWTVHNVDPHESSCRAQRAAFRSLAWGADLLICHDANAASQVATRYRTRGKIVVMPHGNYDGAYPKPGAIHETRRSLGLDSTKPLLCCLGNIRDYKRYDLALEAVKLLGDDVQLLIAGQSGRYDVRILESLAANCENVRLIPGRVSPSRFADFSHAADVILLPYRRITGSGALLSALTFGRSVVASDLPYFRDLLATNPEAGALFEAGNPRALANAIARCLAIPAERRTAAARALAEQYSWDRVIQPVAEVIQGWQETCKSEA